MKKKTEEGLNAVANIFSILCMLGAIWCLWKIVEIASQNGGF